MNMNEDEMTQDSETLTNSLPDFLLLNDYIRVLLSSKSSVLQLLWVS